MVVTANTADNDGMATPPFYDGIRTLDSNYLLGALKAHICLLTATPVQLCTTLRKGHKYKTRACLVQKALVFCQRQTTLYSPRNVNKPQFQFLHCIKCLVMSAMTYPKQVHEMSTEAAFRGGAAQGPLLVLNLLVTRLMPAAFLLQPMITVQHTRSRKWQCPVRQAPMLASIGQQ